VPAVHRRSEAGGRRLISTLQRTVEGGAASTRVAGAAVAVMVCLLTAAAPASAQKDSAVVVGGSYSTYRPSGEDVANHWGVGLVARLRRHSGFGGTLGLNWFKSDVYGEVDGARTRTATVIVRPLMLGPTYTRQFAHFSLAGAVVAGYSFNGLRNTGAVADALAAHGQPGATFDLRNSFVWRPSVTLWWELGNRFGLMLSVSYLSLRPEFVTTTTTGTTRQRMDLSAPLFSVGIGYGVF
jgi:hypothetical protein